MDQVRILQIMPAEAGWRAYYASNSGSQLAVDYEPVVGWALVAIVDEEGQTQEEIQPMLRSSTSDEVTIAEWAREDDPVYLAPPGEPPDLSTEMAERRFRESDRAAG